MTASSCGKGQVMCRHFLYIRTLIVLDVYIQIYVYRSYISYLTCVNLTCVFRCLPKLWKLLLLLLPLLLLFGEFVRKHSALCCYHR